MNDPFQIQPELRYGAPVCDELLTGRNFTIGYSWYFRQAKWTLEIVNPKKKLVTDDVERKDHFRADTRIPHGFRAGVKVYEKRGYHRGHLVASANQDSEEIQNSETFLLSNASPQKPGFNKGVWKKLENAVRKLNKHEDILETYVLTAPYFDYNKKIKVIGDREDEMGINIPVPHGFVKSILAETNTGRLLLWTFMMENKKSDKPIEEFLKTTKYAEQVVGGKFWDRLSGDEIEKQKGQKNLISFKKYR